MKQSERKEKKEARNKKDGKGDAAEEEAPAADENIGIHPARLAMMQNIDRPTHRQRY